MKSGLEGRNNHPVVGADDAVVDVSMESGLDGRNNPSGAPSSRPRRCRLNGVRPRRPEQSVEKPERESRLPPEVSMKSGLEGRNNPAAATYSNNRNRSQ